MRRLGVQLEVIDIYIQVFSALVYVGLSNDVRAVSKVGYQGRIARGNRWDCTLYRQHMGCLGHGSGCVAGYLGKSGKDQISKAVLKEPIAGVEPVVERAPSSR